MILVEKFFLIMCGACPLHITPKDFCLGLSQTAAPLKQQSHKHRHSSTQSFTHWPLDVFAQSLVPAQSETLDQTPPPLIGWERPVPLLCELKLNLLGSPCGAAWVKKEDYDFASDKFSCFSLYQGCQWKLLEHTRAVRYIRNIFNCCKLYHGYTKYIFQIFESILNLEQG